MRRKLTLVRHAKSSWNNLNLSDFERPLNRRGLKNAPEMGKRLVDAKYEVDLIFSSPAVRAMTTAEFIASELEYNLQRIKYDKSIYTASLDELLDLISSIDDGFESVMLVGHNPGLTLLCNHLSNAAIDNMPTCSIAQIQFNINNWRSITENTGELLEFDYPKKS